MHVTHNTPTCHPHLPWDELGCIFGDRAKIRRNNTGLPSAHHLVINALPQV